MHVRCITFVVLWGCSFMQIAVCQDEKEVLRGVTQNSDGSGTISFTPPKLDDEEAHSLHMPATLRCDGCRIIAHQFYEKFHAAHGKRKNLKTLPESEIIDIVESVCSSKFDSCGLKDVNGKKRLSGPGLETADVPGVMQGGGKWPNRLQGMCAQYVEELEEDAIYTAYLEHKSKLENFLCKGKGVLGDCSAKGKDEL